MGAGITVGAGSSRSSRLRPSAAEVLLPPFPVRIHITANSFAEPTIVDVDPRTVDDRVIDVVLR